MIADMAELEKEVRKIVKDGLLWGSCKSYHVMLIGLGYACMWLPALDLHDHHAQSIASACIASLVALCLSQACCCAAAKLVPVGFGIRKMQITAVIEDAKVESMDSIIEEEIVRDGESEYIQSIDVVSFNKL